MIDMKIDGVDQLLTRLRYTATTVKDNARKVMHREAEKIRLRAVLYAPVDDGELEQSIHLEKGYEDNGRLTIEIVAGGMVNGIDVDAYAALIHENYASMKPGKNTEAKRAANPGVYIGEKFLDRAAKDSEPALLRAEIEAVNEALEGF